MGTASPAAGRTSGPRRGFVVRITTATAFGEGLDGYDLGIISVVVPLIVSEFGLSALEEGLLGAASLAGIFVGAPIFGFLTDRYGRRTIFICDLIAFVVLGLLQAFVTDDTELLVLRFLLGFAIGAEYAIGQTMLAELVPSANRGALLSTLQAAWYGGFLLAVIVAYTLQRPRRGLALDPRHGGDARTPDAPAAPGAARVAALAGERRAGARGQEVAEEHLGSDFYEDEDTR